MSTVAVYRSRSSRCCIVINEDKQFVQYISTEEGTGEINTDIRKMAARDFHSDYTELETYPVLRAVEHYLNPLTAAIRITDRANKCLNQLRTDKGIAMNDQSRRTLAERNVIATHKAGMSKMNSVPPVAPCDTIEVVPGSSKKPRKGTWDHKESATESNNEAQRNVVKKHKQQQTKAAKKATRQEQKKRMTEQTENTEVKNEQEAAPNAAQKKPVSKPAAKKAAKKPEPKKAEAKKPAAKAASKKPATTEAKTTTKPAAKKAASKEKTVTTKTETAKKTTAKKAAKAPAKKAATKKAPTKLTKGTGKKAAATKAAPAKKAAGKKDKGQDGARRGRKGAFDEGQKIKLLTKDNPKREGTAAYDTFEALRKAKTVGDFFANGGSSASLHWNIERGYIEVV